MRNPARLLSTFLSLLCLGGLALVLLGCPPSKIQVGAVLPLTGIAQTYGVAINQGLQLAYEEIQSDPSYKTPIRLLPTLDSKSEADAAKELTEQLFSGNALVVIGGATSDEAKSMIEVADKWDRVLMSPSASAPDLSGISRNFYRIFPSDFNAASKMADFATRMMKVETLVMIVEERTYAQGIRGVLEPALQNRGGRVLEVIEIPAGSIGDPSGLVGRVMTLNPDAVYIAAYEMAIGTMIQELRRQSYQGKILTTSAFASATAIARVGQDAEGVFLTQSVFELDSEHAHVQKFVKAYEAKYGEKPDIFAAHGYDAMRVIAAAVEGRPALPSEVPKGLRDAIKEFPGVTGAIQFDEKGDVPKFPRVYVIGEDLGLYDYTDRVKRQQDELRRRREELKKRMDELQKQAAEVAD